MHLPCCMELRNPYCAWLQIIAVHADDPEFKGYDDISQLPKHRLAEIRRCALPSNPMLLN